LNALAEDVLHKFVVLMHLFNCSIKWE
jgi:hypothetical protein